MSNDFCNAGQKREHNGDYYDYDDRRGFYFTTHNSFTRIGMWVSDYLLLHRASPTETNRPLIPLWSGFGSRSDSKKLFSKTGGHE